MRIVSPYDVTPAELVSTSVVNEYANWASGTYNTGDRAIYDNRVHEAVATTTDRPDVGALSDPPTWVYVGWSNQYRMFRDGIDSRSTSVGDIDITLEFSGIVGTVALLGVSGVSARLVAETVADGVIYDKTIQLINIGVQDWWEYYFLEYGASEDAIFDDVTPFTGVTLSLTIAAASASTETSIGRVLAGLSKYIGVALYGTSISFQDYSIKERDGFGNLILVKRRTIKEVKYDVHVNTSGVSDIVRVLKTVAAVPTLYIGEDSMPSTIVFGVYTDVSQGITTPSVSELTITVEEF
jgi:hypothetical protein